MAFEKLENIEKALREFRKNLPNIVVDIIDNDGGKYLDLNRDQMSVGENRTETPIGRLKNPAYAQRKINNGGKAKKGLVDLNNKGNYYKNLKKTVNTKFVNVFTKDPDKEKVKSIEGKYGTQHFNLSETNQSKYSALVIKPELLKYLRSKLNAV